LSREPESTQLLELLDSFTAVKLSVRLCRIFAAPWKSSTQRGVRTVTGTTKTFYRKIRQKHIGKQSKDSLPGDDPEFLFTQYLSTVSKATEAGRISQEPALQD